jgi:hypothetical protein
MKKRESLPLFQALEPEVYLIDTSAWLNIGSHPECEKIWRIIISLIEKGRIVACSEVIEELHNDNIYLRRLKEYEKALQAGDRNDIEFLMEVGRITYAYPSMSRATGSKTPADPYVVALARLERYVVVADESRKRPNRKIRGACDQLGIKCLSLEEFVAAETWPRLKY